MAIELNSKILNRPLLAQEAIEHDSIEGKSGNFSFAVTGPRMALLKIKISKEESVLVRVTDRTIKTNNDILAGELNKIFSPLI